jgi:hypothetical protein
MRDVTSVTRDCLFATFREFPANRRPRIEPRARWPRRLRCARPQTLVTGQLGDRFTLQVRHKDRQREKAVPGYRIHKSKRLCRLWIEHRERVASDS